MTTRAKSFFEFHEGFYDKIQLIFVMSGPRLLGIHRQLSPLELRSTIVPFVIGGCAFLVGYTLVALVVLVNPNRDLIPHGLAGYDAIDNVGLLFYHAHLVGTSEGLALFGESRKVLLDGLTLPLLVYLIIPIVVLTAAGYLTVQFERSTHLSGRETFRSAAKVAAGYGAFALIGIGLVSHTPPSPIGGPIMRPNVGETIVLMCLVFPLLFGTIGGLIATRRW